MVHASRDTADHPVLENMPIDHERKSHKPNTEPERIEKKRKAGKITKRIIRRILKPLQLYQEKAASMKRLVQGIYLLLILIGAPLLIIRLFKESRKSAHGAIGREIHNSGACHE